MDAKPQEVQVIAVNDRVRSYDFQDPSDGQNIPTCYVEGVVEAIDTPSWGYSRYKIRVTRRVFEGREVPWRSAFPDGYCYPPVNGTSSWTGRVTNGVVKIPAEDPMQMLLRACKVISLDPKIRGWLKENDPKALEQVERAIRAAEGGGQ